MGCDEAECYSSALFALSRYHPVSIEIRNEHKTEVTIVG
jgi:hypothetical protein